MPGMKRIKNDKSSRNYDGRINELVEIKMLQIRSFVNSVHRLGELTHSVRMVSFGIQWAQKALTK